MFTTGFCGSRTVTLPLLEVVVDVAATAPLGDCEYRYFSHFLRKVDRAFALRNRITATLSRAGSSTASSFFILASFTSKSPTLPWNVSLSLFDLWEPEGPQILGLGSLYLNRALSACIRASAAGFRVMIRAISSPFIALGFENSSASSTNELTAAETSRTWRLVPLGTSPSVRRSEDPPDRSPSRSSHPQPSEAPSGSDSQ